jgi:poly [ADP-ribose] polymerase
MKNNNSGQAKLNILEILGLEITEIQSRETIHLIKKLMDNESNRFVSAYKVINKRTQKLFDAMLTFQANKATHLFWHGSRNENWLSILETGLVLRPANAAISGKMFGYGLYFADRFRKSLNYTSINGSFWARGSSNRAYLSLFAVHTGNPYIIENRESWHGNMTSTMLQTKGDFDSVSALKGFDLINNEYIVYRENQCTIQYLVEIKTA